MFTIGRKIEIDAGHRVPYHGSQCRFLHGHRWKIVAHVRAYNLVEASPERPDSGMVVDFGVIKQVLMEEIHAKYDHRLILWEQDPLLQEDPLIKVACGYGFAAALKEAGILESIRTVPCIPTAEGLAEHWASLIEAPLQGAHFRLSALEVWETPNSVVVWESEAYGSPA